MSSDEIQFPICIGSSGLNAGLGLILLVAIILYDILNPDRDANKDTFLSFIIWWACVILTLGNLASFVPKEIEKLFGKVGVDIKSIGKTSGGGRKTKCRGYKGKMKGGGNDDSIFEKIKEFIFSEIKLIIKVLNMSFFIVGYLYIKYKPDSVSNILFTYLVLFIIFLSILYMLTHALLEEWGEKFTILQTLKDAFANESVIIKILLFQLYLLFLMSIFSFFQKFEGSLMVFLIKFMYIGFFAAMCIGLDYYYMIEGGGCKELDT